MASENIILRVVRQYPKGVTAAEVARYLRLRHVWGYSLKVVRSIMERLAGQGKIEPENFFINEPCYQIRIKALVETLDDNERAIINAFRKTQRKYEWRSTEALCRAIGREETAANVGQAGIIANHIEHNLALLKRGKMSGGKIGYALTPRGRAVVVAMNRREIKQAKQA